ncbi:PTB-containing, cubilin and LRP1-interacting protein [Syngnathus acus]|uniref:PTB-containing, cubilin and LRP1-interacting protein n=1 Tax=Syngnathus acus TaxID=161584 RepID=UPI001885D14B|nr:PTB-containing, cubilin and LRP1-interacting protein [Syngnathus acus]XP_049582704.1 PTB-containing, cubilin and LRP1-interacting protein [Syngnathus scovelli]XP_061136949.1 PTB-containing, cubilin and LRP1-interacting protein [Syngnathus typhle]
MWQPASERLQHFQSMLKTKLNVLTLRKEPLPTVIFHEPEAIELCSTTPLTKNKTQAGYKVTYLGKVTISGTNFLSGCTESAVVGLVEHRALANPGSSLLEIRPFQVRLHHLDGHGEASVTMDTYQVARIAYCTADHSVRPNVFAWIYRQINDDLTFQMDCHAVECESKLEAKKLAHSMMEAFRKTFHSMRCDGRIHKSGSSDEFAEDSSTPEDSTPDDG